MFRPPPIRCCCAAADLTAGGGAGGGQGLYSDVGTKTCGGQPGSFGHECADAATFAAYHAGADHMAAQEEAALQEAALASAHPNSLRRKGAGARTALVT